MSNPFDELGKQPEWPEEDQKHFEKIEYLIHYLFSQNDKGKELLAIWEDYLLMNPTVAYGGENLLEVGIAEGYKQFIRNIILTIRKVENE